jgi:acetylornithine/LysW-gamma-L-lysine aminotransferase
LATDVAATDRIRSAEDAHSSGAVPRRPVAIVRGEGALLWDSEGREYVDLASAQGWASLGHGHPDVTAAIRSQLSRIVAHTESSYNDVRALWFEEMARVLGERLGRTALGAISRIQPTSSGAEAIEAAIKLAAATTGRSEFVAIKRAFHGRTLGALSATANPRYRAPFEALLTDFTHVAPGDAEAARAAITERTAAVLVEIVQGEGGVHPLETSYLAELRRLSEEKGALLVVDEIQTGLGRTGKWFACEHAGVLPDVITLGKCVGGGIPMGVAAWREGIGKFEPATHGSTFGGNPLACAASRAVLAVLERDALPERAARLGARVREELAAMRAPVVREVRGLGFMVGIELKKKVAPVLEALVERGVWALPAGLNVLRLLPPLVIAEEHLERALVEIREVLGES